MTALGRRPAAPGKPGSQVSLVRRNRETMAMFRSVSLGRSVCAGLLTVFLLAGMVGCTGAPSGTPASSKPDTSKVPESSKKEPGGDPR